MYENIIDCGMDFTSELVVVVSVKTDVVFSEEKNETEKIIGDLLSLPTFIVICSVLFYGQYNAKNNVYRTKEKSATERCLHRIHVFSS